MKFSHFTAYIITPQVVRKVVLTFLFKGSLYVCSKVKFLCSLKVLLIVYFIDIYTPSGKKSSFDITI